MISGVLKWLQFPAQYLALFVKEESEDTRGYSESVNRRTDNTMSCLPNYIVLCTVKKYSKYMK